MKWLFRFLTDYLKTEFRSVREVIKGGSKEYKAVIGHTPEGLMDLVSDEMADGWRPVGGIDASILDLEQVNGLVDIEGVYIQAMIR